MGNIQQSLQQSLQAINKKQYTLAEQYLTAILNAIPEEPNALFLLGGVRQRQHRFDEAENLMVRSLTKHPLQADVLNTLGNLMGKMEKPQQAIIFFQQALKKRPQFAIANFNLGLTYNKLAKHSEAVKALTTASEQAPDNAQIWSALGCSFKDLMQFEEALHAFDKALKIKPGYIKALNNKGLTLRLLQRPEEAINCYQQALPIGSDIPELHFNIACASYDSGKKEDAEISLNKAITLKPDYVLAHETLNKMYWEHGESDKFTQTFQKAIKVYPESIDLRVSYANQLKMAKRGAEAVEILNTAMRELGAAPKISHCLGQLYGQTGNAELAVEHISNAVKLEPTNERYRIDVSNFLIQKHQYNEAMIHLDAAQISNPFEQEMWALKGLCWRFTGDDRDAWLNDYDRFIKAKILDTPEGYDNFEHFIHDLRKALINMHNTIETPLDQSVRYGTQTAGRLLYQPVKEVIDYRTVLEKRVREYLSELPDDQSHPFLSRKTENFRFSGSWSVRLQSEGFHVNHVHPDGWFSGPTYIEVPQSIRSDDPKKAGWVTFGETGMNLGPDREKIVTSVCPQEGLCAFFPSYIWHGTIPFHSDEHRMTTPCDIVPLV